MNVIDRKEKELYFKYYIIAECLIPNIFKYILNQGCKLQNNQSYYDKLVVVLGSSGKVRNSYKSDQLKKLTLCDNSLFDASLLFKLIFDICLKDCFKDNLTKLKNRRNQIAHKTLNEKITEFGKKSSLQEIKDDILKLLHDVNSAFNINVSNYQTKKKEILTKYDNIINDKDYLVMYGICNLKKRALDLYSEVNLFPWLPTEQTKISSTFVKQKLVRCNNAKTEEVDVLSILKNFKEGKAGCSIITGTAGSGKTMLLKYIYNTWATDNYAQVEMLQNYDFVFFVECREQYIDSLGKYFRIVLPDVITSNKTDYEKLLATLKKKTLLFLIDGTDETNSSSLKLLTEIKCEFGLSHFVFTCRPDSKESWSIVIPSSVCYEFRIEGMSDEILVDFITKYLAEHCQDKQQANEVQHKLINTLKNMSKDTKDILSLPINLVIYINLIINSKEKASLDVLLITDLYYYLYEAQIRYLSETIDSNQLGKNTGIYLSIKHLVNEIEKIAYECSLNDKIYFSKEQFGCFANSCDTKYCKCFNKIITCFISYDKSQIFNNLPYKFHHKRLQDFMAARYIQRQLSYDSSFIKYLKEQDRDRFYNRNLILLSLITREDNENEYRVHISSELAQDIFCLFFNQNEDVVYSVPRNCIENKTKLFLDHTRGNKNFEKNKELKIHCNALLMRDYEICNYELLINALEYVDTQCIIFQRFSYKSMSEHPMQFLNKCKTRRIHCSIAAINGTLPADIITHLPIVRMHMDIHIKSQDQVTALSEWRRRSRFQGVLHISLHQHVRGLCSLRDKVHLVKIEVQDDHEFIANVIDDLYSPNKCHNNLIRGDTHNVKILSDLKPPEDFKNQIDKFLRTKMISIKVSYGD